MPTITDRRAAIDELDAQLVALIQQRLAVSNEIQKERLAAGGPRVVHSREAEVVARWRAELGAPGSRIALALLELARGSVVAS